MADNRTAIVITAQDRASEVLRRLSGSVDGMQRSFEGLSTPLLRFQSLWASLVGGAVVAGIRSLIDAIDDLDEAAQGLGLTAVELSNLRRAAIEAGIGAETFEASLTRLNVKVSDAASGNKEAAALFKALGVAVRDAGGNVRPTAEVLADLANRFAGLEGGQGSPAKAALAVDLFGKSGAKLIPLLNQGAAGLERFSGLTADTVREAARVRAELDQFNAEFERMEYAIAGGALPAINAFLAATRKIDFSDVAVSFTGGPIAGLTRTLAQLGAATKVQLDRQEQVRQALSLSAGSYSNEGRQALQNAQAIRDKAAADLAGESASKKKSKATEQASNAYAQEFADVARIRAARERFDQEQEDAANRERDRRAARINDLTGRSEVKKQAEDLQLLDEALAKGQINLVEHMLGVSEALGQTNKEIKETTELADGLALTTASSLGELITSGGRAGDVWKALGQDVAKLITQMLILKPLAKDLQNLFGGGEGGSAGFSFVELFNRLVGAVGGAGVGGSGGRNADGSWGVGGSWDGGAAPGVTINNYIDGAVDRARIASYVETGVKVGLARSWDSVARGGSGVLST